MIKEARMKAGLSQMDACRLLDIPRRTLQDWEAGLRKPKGDISAILDKIQAVGQLTEPERASLLAGDLSMDGIVLQYKQSRVRAEGNLDVWDRIPDSIKTALPADLLVELSQVMK